MKEQMRKIFFSILIMFIFLSTFKLEMDIKASEPLETTTEEVTTVKDGFYKKNKKRIFYQDGKIYKGFLTYKKKKYYFDKNGHMVTGFHKIGKNYYLFSKKGVMKTGFHKRKYKKKKIFNYYDSKGRLKIGKFKIKKTAYKSKKKSGKIYYVFNNVKVLCQRPELPTGCEITSWTMMAKYAGVRISKTKAANIMPRSSNPNYGFMGSPYQTTGRGLVVYPLGLKGMTKKYLGNFTNLTGCSIETIKSKLIHQKPVMVWVCGLDGFNSHTVLLTGYDTKGFFYNDPWTGTKRKMLYRSFFGMWRGNGKRAMSY